MKGFHRWASFLPIWPGDDDDEEDDIRDYLDEDGTVDIVFIVEEELDHSLDWRRTLSRRQRFELEASRGTKNTADTVSNAIDALLNLLRKELDL